MRQKSCFRSAVHHHVSLLCLICSLKYFMYALIMTRSSKTRTEINECPSGRRRDKLKIFRTRAEGGGVPTVGSPYRGRNKDKLRTISRRVVLKNFGSRIEQVILVCPTVRISRNLKMSPENVLRRQHDAEFHQLKRTSLAQPGKSLAP